MSQDHFQTSTEPKKGHAKTKNQQKSEKSWRVGHEDGNHGLDTRTQEVMTQHGTELIDET